MKHAFRALRPERFNAYLAEPSTGSFKSLVLAVSVSQCEVVSSELLLDKINKFPIWRIGKIVSVSYLCSFESMFLITHENSVNMCKQYRIPPSYGCAWCRRRRWEEFQPSGLSPCRSESEARGLFARFRKKVIYCLKSHRCVQKEVNSH